MGRQPFYNPQKSGVLSTLGWLLAGYHLILTVVALVISMFMRSLLVCHLWTGTIGLDTFMVASTNDSSALSSALLGTSPVSGFNSARPPSILFSSTLF